jgi:thiol-disulfide isomerase/thioredoxin
MRNKILVVLTAVVPMCFSPAAPAGLPKVGARAPDFVLKSGSGHNVRLSELRGQVVMINFWASWCGPCRQELPKLDKLQARYRSAGFALLAINLDDDRGNADGMLRRLGVRLAPLYDADKRTAKRYDVDTMPATLIVDRDGRVRYVHRGYRSGYENKYESEIRELLTR